MYTCTLTVAMPIQSTPPILPCSLTFHFNITLPSRPRFSTWCLSLSFSHQTCMYPYRPLYVLHITAISNVTWAWLHKRFWLVYTYGSGTRQRAGNPRNRGSITSRNKRFFLSQRVWNLPSLLFNEYQTPITSGKTAWAWRSPLTSVSCRG